MGVSFFPDFFVVSLKVLIFVAESYHFKFGNEYGKMVWGTAVLD